MELGRRQSDRSFHESPDLLAVVTAEGVLKVVNAAWEKALGYRAEELIGRPFFKLVDDHDRVTAIKLVNPRLAIPGSPVIELPLRCKDLSYRSFLWNRRYIVAEQTVFLTGRDIRTSDCTSCTPRPRRQKGPPESQEADRYVSARQLTRTKRFPKRGDSQNAACGKGGQLSPRQARARQGRRQTLADLRRSPPAWQARPQSICSYYRYKRLIPLQL